MLIDSVCSKQKAARGMSRVFFFFFKQKTAYEIYKVTGVQTCALPISPDAAPGGDRGTCRRAGERRSSRPERHRPDRETRPFTWEHERCSRARTEIGRAHV